MKSDDLRHLAGYGVAMLYPTVGWSLRRRLEKQGRRWMCAENRRVDVMASPLSLRLSSFLILESLFLHQSDIEC